MKKIKITWLNHKGQIRTHTIFNDSLQYAKALWTETILSSAGWAEMTIQEKRESQMKFVSAEFLSS